MLITTVPGLERMVLTHFHADHVGGATALRSASQAEVIAGAGDAEILRGEAEAPPAVLEDWERPLFETTSKGLPSIVQFRRQAELDLEVVCFGHGEPLVGAAGKRLREAAVAL